MQSRSHVDEEDARKRAAAMADHLQQQRKDRQSPDVMEQTILKGIEDGAHAKMFASKPGLSLGTKGVASATVADAPSHRSGPKAARGADGKKKLQQQLDGKAGGRREGGSTSPPLKGLKQDSSRDDQRSEAGSSDGGVGGGGVNSGHAKAFASKPGLSLGTRKVLAAASSEAPSTRGVKSSKGKGSQESARRFESSSTRKGGSGAAAGSSKQQQAASTKGSSGGSTGSSSGGAGSPPVKASKQHAWGLPFDMPWGGGGDASAGGTDVAGNPKSGAGGGGGGSFTQPQRQLMEITEIAEEDGYASAEESCSAAPAAALPSASVTAATAGGAAAAAAAGGGGRRRQEQRQQQQASAHARGDASSGPSFLTSILSSGSPPRDKSPPQPEGQKAHRSHAGSASSSSPQRAARVLGRSSPERRDGSPTSPPGGPLVPSLAVPASRKATPAPSSMFLPPNDRKLLSMYIPPTRSQLPGRKEVEDKASPSMMLALKTVRRRGRSHRISP